MVSIVDALSYFWYIWKLKFLSNKQWGFTKGKSTTGALLTAVHNWHKLLEDGQSVCAVFFDFKKAFNNVPHSILMSI